MSKLPIYQIKKFHCNSDENDLYVNDFKSHLQANDFIESSHSHNFYLLVLFTNGKGTHTIDFNTYEITRGSLFFLKPGQVHSWHLSTDIGGYIAFYSKEVYDLYFGRKRLDDYSFYSMISNVPVMQIPQEVLEKIAHYFELMNTDAKGQHYRKNDKILNTLDSIHIELDRLHQFNLSHKVSVYYYKIQTLKEMVETYFRTDKAPSFYADKMNVSLKHLNRICRDVLNITVTEFIFKRVILESKRMLSIEGVAVNEVALSLGFENYSYFTKVFKKYTGQTPQSFRKSL